MSAQLKPEMETEIPEPPSLEEEVDLSVTDEDEESARAIPRLQHLRTLVLNGDYQPWYVEPLLSLVPWATTFKWIAKGDSRMRVGGAPIIAVLAEYDETIRTQHRVYRIPAVVAFTKVHRIRQGVKFNRDNVFLRDNYTCQYTGIRYPKSELTLDHILPASRGGKDNWLNLVTCHKDVNYRKADKTPEEAGLKLLRQPFAPTVWDMKRAAKENRKNDLLHPLWLEFLPEYA